MTAFTKAAGSLQPEKGDSGRKGRASFRGSALVISLVFIILITIAIVGFVTTAALERKTVQSHFAGVQADLYNSMAVGVVASRITMATTQTNTWWVSQPGRIVYTTSGSGVNSPTNTWVDLTSGTAAAVQTDVAVDLNPASLTQGTGLIVADTTAKLPVKWVYVRKDGTQEKDLTNAPAYSLTNPVLGRYAYWTDDESARLNVNTAVSSTVAFGENDPDLTTLSTGTGTLSLSDVQKLKNLRVTDKRRFGSVDELKAADNAPAIAQAVKQNQESLTHYSHSPGLNRFGEPRIVLTTQENLAGGMPFFDILTTPNSDPGVDANLSPAKIQTLFAKLFPYFNKTAAEWGISYNGSNPTPSAYGSKTLFQKYDNDSRFVAQIILNLIDYVRSVESTRTMILPLRAAFSGTTLTYGVGSSGLTGNFGPNAIRGNSRRIHIVEMGVFLPAAPVMEDGKLTYTGKLKLRVFLPLTAGSSVELAGLSVQPYLRSALGGGLSEFTLGAANFTEGSVINPGEYRTITKDDAKIVVSGVAERPKVYIRLAIKTGLGGIGYDLVPSQSPSEPMDYLKMVNYQVDAASFSESDMTSVSVDDPVINQNYNDWTAKSDSQLKNRFHTQSETPESTLKLPPDPTAVMPQQDARSDGQQKSDVSVRPPYPKGMGDNIAGVVKSVGEIGRVHSGGAGTSLAGKPWRTLRLQPRLAPQVFLPDWLLLDLFTVPFKTPVNLSDNVTRSDASLLRPATDNVTWTNWVNNSLTNSFTAMGGRINLNEQIYPFGDLARNAPLQTVIKAIKPSLTDALAKDLADNVKNQTVATALPFGSYTSQGLIYGTASFVTNKMYLMPGEVCEIAGIATGEEEEGFVRNLVGYLTTRSNVFSVFSVGQKIQQLPNGQIKVLGESRTRTLLERDNGRVRTVSTTELGL